MVDMDTLVVRTSMMQGAGHILYERPAHRFLMIEVQNAADCAHSVSSAGRAASRMIFVARIATLFFNTPASSLSQKNSPRSRRPATRISEAPVENTTISSNRPRFREQAIALPA